MLLGELLALEEGASRLGVSRARLRQRLLAGDMLGVKRAGAWFIPSLEIKRWADLPRAAHRPFSADRAWKMLMDVSNGELTDIGKGLPGQLHRRAQRHVLYAHPGLLSKIRASKGVMIGGIEAIGHSEVVGSYPIRDLYASQSGAIPLRKRLDARPAVDDINVVLHVTPHLGAIPPGGDPGHVAELVAALDLLEGYDARVRAMGRELWAARLARAA